MKLCLQVQTSNMRETSPANHLNSFRNPPTNFWLLLKLPTSYPTIAVNDPTSVQVNWRLSRNDTLSRFLSANAVVNNNHFLKLILG